MFIFIFSSLITHILHQHLLLIITTFLPLLHHHISSPLNHINHHTSPQWLLPWTHSMLPSPAPRPSARAAAATTASRTARRRTPPTRAAVATTSQYKTSFSICIMIIADREGMTRTSKRSRRIVCIRRGTFHWFSVLFFFCSSALLFYYLLYLLQHHLHHIVLRLLDPLCTALRRGTATSMQHTAIG